MHTHKLYYYSAEYTFTTLTITNMYTLHTQSARVPVKERGGGSKTSSFSWNNEWREDDEGITHIIGIVIYLRIYFLLLITVLIRKPKCIQFKHKHHLHVQVQYEKVEWKTW